MFPTINLKETGKNLRKIMKERGITVKEVQQYLGLGSVQSVYHWLNGLSLPTMDNLYALSVLFNLPLDDLVCGNKKELTKGKDTGNSVDEKDFYLASVNNNCVA